MSKTDVCDAEITSRDGEFSDRSQRVTDAAAQTLASATNVAALSLISTTLLEIWQELLHVSAIKPSDDFFDLGGDSLAAIRMLERLGRKFGEELLEPDIIYTASRFDELTSAIAEALARHDSNHLSN